MKEYEQTDYTKHYIVEALFRLMKEQEFSAISVTDIAKKAGVGRATFYRCFKSKEEVIVYYFRQKTQTFLQNRLYRPRYESDYYEVMLSVFQMLKEEKEFVKLLQTAHLEYLYVDYINQKFARLDSFSKDNAYTPYVYAGALYNVSMQWLKNDCKEPPETLAAAMFTMIYGKEKYREVLKEHGN